MLTPIDMPTPAVSITESRHAQSDARQLPRLVPTGAIAPTEAAPAASIDATVARIAMSGDPKAVLSEQAATQIANHAEQWLNRFGQAQVKLGFNKRNFSLDQSEITGLFPLQQQELQLLFTQLGLHYQRATSTTLNLGIGQRHVMSNQWLLGYNLFYDVLLQHRHQRLGLGAEARRDYLSLAVNGYYPLSSWKIEDKAASHLARPARGIDLMLNAYLPQHPQLGVLMNAERYFDAQIGACDASNANHQRVKALTLGINYTPVPLVQVGYHYTLGQQQANKSKQHILLTMNYQLGVPLAQQLDSDRVAQLRTLMGSQLDPVQRNNQVVLAYKANDKAPTAAAKGPLYQIQLPEDEIGNVNGVITIPWNFSGDLSTSDLQFHGSLAQRPINISDDKKFLKITLPDNIGDYDLQVEVLDQQGQRVVLSNSMNVQVVNVPGNVLQAARDIRKPGSWNNAAGGLLTALIVRTPIWPTGVALHVLNNHTILNQFETRDDYRYYVNGQYVDINDQPQPTSTINIYYNGCNHYMILNSNNVPIDAPAAPGSTGGDCFYNSILSELRGRGIHMTALELRKMAARALLENFSDVHLAVA